MKFTSFRRTVTAFALCALLAALPLAGRAQLREATPQESQADAAAFAVVEQALAQLTDIQSAVVLLNGRVAFAFHRDGQPDALRNVQSVEKSALALLVGAALRQGHLPGLDVRVTTLMREWAALNPDPRASGITLRHLLTMSAGFDISDTAGTAAKLPPAKAWARALAAAPGEKFAYDNSAVPLIAAVLEKATGMPLAEYAQRTLVEPLGMATPRYGWTVNMRTLDMAKLGQLVLDGGAWGGTQLLAPEYVTAATRAQNGGGPPANLPYGFLWWVLPGEAQPPIAFASGYGGQMIWLHPQLRLVVAVTSTVSPDSQRRGHAVQLLRRGLVAAAEERVKEGAGR